MARWRHVNRLVNRVLGSFRKSRRTTDSSPNHKFVYDYRNRLIQVKTQADANIAKYHYDGLNRRVQKDLESGTDVVDVDAMGLSLFGWLGRRTDEIGQGLALVAPAAAEGAVWVARKPGQGVGLVGEGVTGIGMLTRRYVPVIGRLAGGIIQGAGHVTCAIGDLAADCVSASSPASCDESSPPATPTACLPPPPAHAGES